MYEVLLSMSLLGLGTGTMLANCHMCGIMLVLTAVFNMLVRNVSPRGPMCFRCLMFNLCPCIFCVSLLMDASVVCLTVVVNCLVKQFAPNNSRCVWVCLMFCC